VLVGFLTGLGVGIASAPHCLGMCGGFPLHLARGAKGWHALLRPLLFVAGKAFTYGFIGALAGFAGSAIAGTSLFSQSQHILAYGGGAVMVVFGLAMLGVRLPRALRGVGIGDWGLVSKVYGDFFAAPTTASSLYLGLAAGFLPCPVTLVMLAPAVASHQVLTGIAIMAGVGLGTAPVLLAAGLFGSAVGRPLRVLGLRAAGAIVIGVGVLLVLRGTGLLCPGDAACHHHASRPVSTASIVR